MSGWFRSALAAAVILLSWSAAAEPVLERVRRTGVLEAGTRADAVPFAFRRDDGRLAGFSVDLLGAIRERVERELGRPVELRLTVTTPQNRIGLVRDAAIALECGITTATWGREREIDFSIPFFIDGTRVLTRRADASSLADLRGRRVGVLEASSTEAILRADLPDATPVAIPDLRRGVAMLLAGELDGVANVGIVLRAQIEGIDGQSRFVLLPRGDVLSWEALACMLPQGDSAWRDFVNGALAELLVGVERYRGGWVELYERWFGVQGEVFYPLNQDTAERLAAALAWLD